MARTPAPETEPISAELRPLSPIARKRLSTPKRVSPCFGWGWLPGIGSQINRGCAGNTSTSTDDTTSPTPCHHPPANSDPYEHPETVTFVALREWVGSRGICQGGSESTRSEEGSSIIGC